MKKFLSILIAGFFMLSTLVSPRISFARGDVLVSEQASQQAMQIKVEFLNHLAAVYNKFIHLSEIEIHEIYLEELFTQKQYILEIIEPLEDEVLRQKVIDAITAYVLDVKQEIHNLSKEQILEYILIAEEELSHLGLLKDIVIWIANLTWGLPNSVIGLGVVIVLGGMKTAFAMRDPSIGFPQVEWSKNGKQFYVDLSNVSLGFNRTFSRFYDISFPDFAASEISLGIWHIDLRGFGGGASFHEGGHAIQSALIGPFYLPLVLGSYAVQGPSKSFMEDWANELARRYD